MVMRRGSGWILGFCPPSKCVKREPCGDPRDDLILTTNMGTWLDTGGRSTGWKLDRGEGDGVESENFPWH